MAQVLTVDGYSTCNCGCVLYFQIFPVCPFGPNSHGTGVDRIARSRTVLEHHPWKKHHCKLMSVRGREWTVSDKLGQVAEKLRWFKVVRGHPRSSTT